MLAAESLFTNQNPRNTSSSSAQMQIALARFNRKRIAPSYPTDSWKEELFESLSLQVVEGRFVENERRGIFELASGTPMNPKEFIEWFEGLKEWGPGQNDPLFRWLAEEASLDQLKWFLTQEIAGEAGFDDLVAMTQVKLPETAKLELARNYWDEMGRGQLKGMHGPMLEKVSEELQLTPSIEGTVWESLALANLMTALAVNRRYTFHSVGALGAIEMTAPGRVARVNEGLKRLGFDHEVRKYYEIHAHLDIRHSAAWNREVLYTLVDQDANTAVAIAEGALMRLKAGERCFERYRKKFGI